MAATLSQADTTNDATRVNAPAVRGWLFSRRIDLAMLGVPLLLAVVGFCVEQLHGGGSARLLERSYATFVAQYVLGNTTHVILTFLLLGVRRDLLDPVPGQKATIMFGSAGAFGAAFALFWITSMTYPIWIDFGLAISIIFAQHHRLSQVKGLWALYSLRSKQKFNPFERKIQSAFVPIGLVALMARILCFERAPRTMFAPIVPIPGIPAPIPFTGVYVLVAAYLVFGVVGMIALTRANASLPKKLYVGTHFLVIAFTLYAPVWGAVVTSGIHGLEYYLLSVRMLGTREGDKTKIEGASAWGLMFAAMSPAIVIGLMSGPFSRLFEVNAESWAVRFAVIVLNSVVMAHYFADAFLYRLRLPEVRKVVLRRLGFA